MITAETQRRGEHKKIGPAPGAGSGFAVCPGLARRGSRGSLRLALLTDLRKRGVPSAASARESHKTAPRFEASGVTGNPCFPSASLRLSGESSTCGELRNPWKS